MLKWLLTKRLRNLPATLAATFLIEVYGLIKIRPRGLKWFANRLAGPVPIDLPKIRTSLELNPSPPCSLLLKICYMTIDPFTVIFFAVQLSLVPKSGLLSLI